MSNLSYNTKKIVVKKVKINYLVKLINLHLLYINSCKVNIRNEKIFLLIPAPLPHKSNSCLLLFNFNRISRPVSLINVEFTVLTIQVVFNSSNSHSGSTPVFLFPFEALIYVFTPNDISVSFVSLFIHDELAMLSVFHHTIIII